MFDRIAPRYDQMNSVMTAGLDRAWRRAALNAARLRPGMRVVDVACGTGRLTRGAARGIGVSGAAIGVDVSDGMLDRARAGRRDPAAAPITYVVGDALALPVADGSCDAALIGFGLRNLADYAVGVRELRRVVRPGGRVVILEIGEARRGVPRLLHRTWFRGVVPLLGRLIGERDAYRYLPDSVDRYPRPTAVADLLRAAGLADVEWRWLTGGMVTFHAATVPGVP